MTVLGKIRMRHQSLRVRQIVRRIGEGLNLPVVLDKAEDSQFTLQVEADLPPEVVESLAKWLTGFCYALEIPYVYAALDGNNVI